jgi:hypothetical protein
MVVKWYVTNEFIDKKIKSNQYEKIKFTLIVLLFLTTFVQAQKNTIAQEPDMISQ